MDEFVKLLTLEFAQIELDLPTVVRYERIMADDGFVPMADTLQLRVDGDVVRVRNCGLMTLRDLYALLDVYGRVRVERGMLFAVFDCSRAQGMERDTRKAMMGEASAMVHADATAIFGAPFAIRTLSNMIERARIGLGRTPTGVRFFENEKQSKDYIDAQRSLFLSRRPAH